MQNIETYRNILSRFALNLCVSVPIDPIMEVFSREPTESRVPHVGGQIVVVYPIRLRRLNFV